MFASGSAEPPPSARPKPGTTRAAPSPFAVFVAADLCTKEGIVELFCAREVACRDDQSICCQINSCSPCQILTPNFPRVALSYGIAVHNGDLVLARLNNLSNFCKWLELFDCMARARTPNNRPLLSFYSENDFRDIVGSSQVDDLIKGVTLMTPEVFLPREPFAFAPNFVSIPLHELGQNTGEDENTAEASGAHEASDKPKTTDDAMPPLIRGPIRCKPNSGWAPYVVSRATEKFEKAIVISCQKEDAPLSGFLQHQNFF
jgi:hypothetical protein